MSKKIFKPYGKSEIDLETDRRAAKKVAES